MQSSVRVARYSALWQLSNTPHFCSVLRREATTAYPVLCESHHRLSLSRLQPAHSLHTGAVCSSMGGSSLSMGGASRSMGVASSSVAEANATPLRALYRYLKPGGLLYSLARRCGILEVPKYRLRIASDRMIEAIVDGVDYEQFYRHCDMTDTFLSWYLVTELHIWMLCVRLMENGNEGALCKNFVIEHLWSDIRIRLKKLGVVGGRENYRQLLISSDAFKGALIGYDEGLFDDRLLSAVLWRRLFFYRCEDLTRLETVVAYVRRELARMDKLNAFQLFFVKDSIHWGSLKSL